MTFRESLRHAFAVEPPGPHAPNEQQFPVVDRLCRRVAKGGLALPGVVALEMSRPLGYMGSQFMRWATPIIHAMVRRERAENFALLSEYLEHRGSIEWMCQRIEWYEQGGDDEALSSEAEARSDEGAR